MNNIKFYRTKACKTAASVAKELKISRQIYCFIENDHLHRPLPVDRLNQICEILKVNRVDLMGDELFAYPVETDEDRAILIKRLFAQIKNDELKESIKEYVKEEKN